MQDVQNIPTPDVNSAVEDNDFGNHSGIQKDYDDSDAENIPLPPDEKMPAPIEEPSDTEKPPIREDDPQPAKIV